MKTYTVEQLIEKFGGQDKLAELCNVTQGRVSQMRKDGRLSVKSANSLIRATGLKHTQLPIGLAT